jgi:hypothetical protein
MPMKLSVAIVLALLSIGCDRGVELYIKMGVQRTPSVQSEPMQVAPTPAPTPSPTPCPPPSPKPTPKPLPELGTAPNTPELGTAPCN